jgi:hypothetical protein
MCQEAVTEMQGYRSSKKASYGVATVAHKNKEDVGIIICYYYLSLSFVGM